MAIVQERLAYVEGRVQEQSNRFDGLQLSLDRLEQKMDDRLGALDAKMSRQFYWLVGVQVTTLTAIIVSLAAG